MKGAGTIVALSETEAYINTTGNPGMATGGMGDMLTGIITALLAQGYSCSESAILGVCMHGHAGDKAKELYGEIGVTPTRMLNLPIGY
jgi:NAD(P)H-hydrate epimerase